MEDVFTALADPTAMTVFLHPDAVTGSVAGFARVSTAEPARGLVYFDRRPGAPAPNIRAVAGVDGEALHRHLRDVLRSTPG